MSEVAERIFRDKYLALFERATVSLEKIAVSLEKLDGEAGDEDE